jgi:hypothetical protein
MSLLNFGGGLAAMGQSVAAFAGNAAMAQQKSDLEKQQAVLADQLATTRETTLAHVQGGEARQTAVETAGAQGAQVRETADHENKLPMTAAQQATTDNATATLKETTRAHIAEENKPISGGYTGSFLVKDPAAPGGYRQVSATATSTPITIDKESNNLSAQTGLSNAAINVMTGQTKGQRFSAQQSAAVQKEITDWGVKNGINTATMLPQAAAHSKIIEFNLTRNNQANILENEMSGTIDSAADIVDQIGAGRVKMVDVLAVWGGKQVNDPNALKAADQLGRLRNELAGYNAVAGGNLMENGTPRPTPEDFHNADATISNGISSGGLKALQQSVAQSAAKNRNVLDKAIDDASAAYYALFGATYHPTAPAKPPASQEPPAAGAGAVPVPAKTPALPSGVPSGSQFSASRQQWRSPDGKIYDADGNEVK